MTRRFFAVLFIAALGGCAPGVTIDANHEGGVVRYRTGTGQDSRHEEALARAVAHCRSQGFTTDTIEREYDEPGVLSIGFKCRN